MTSMVCDLFGDDAFEDHVLHHLHRVEARLETLGDMMTSFSSEQAHTDADVSSLRSDFDAFKAKIAAEVQAVKDAQAAGQPVDLSKLDALVADENAETAPPVPTPVPAPTPTPAPSPDPSPAPAPAPTPPPATA